MSLLLPLIYSASDMTPIQTTHAHQMCDDQSIQTTTRAIHKETEESLRPILKQLGLPTVCSRASISARLFTPFANRRALQAPRRPGRIGNQMKPLAERLLMLQLSGDTQLLKALANALLATPTDLLELSNYAQLRPVLVSLTRSVESIKTCHCERIRTRTRATARTAPLMQMCDELAGGPSRIAGRRVPQSLERSMNSLWCAFDRFEAVLRSAH